jgi:hypothetical protein
MQKYINDKASTHSSGGLVIYVSGNEAESKKKPPSTDGSFLFVYD